MMNRYAQFFKRRLSMSKPASSKSVEPPIRTMSHGPDVRMQIFFTAAKKTPKPGMFGRLFPQLPALKPNPQHLAELGMAMIETTAQSGNAALDSTTPAGFTYLGQFVDH